MKETTLFACSCLAVMTLALGCVKDKPVTTTTYSHAAGRVAVIGDISVTFTNDPSPMTALLLLDASAYVSTTNKWVFIIPKFDYRNQKQGAAIEAAINDNATFRRYP